MGSDERVVGDAALTVVPLVGRLLATGTAAEPYRLVDAGGDTVEPDAEFFRELQAAGRSPATVRSYGLGLLRWFRFLWALQTCCDRATRDRAWVAFYVSTGARASELLSVVRSGVDPGRQLISVVRKGSGEMAQLPASSDAFVWLRLYELEMDGMLPAGRRQPLWWTLRRP